MCIRDSVELVGKLRDRSVRTPELLKNAASGGVRERSERSIEASCRILNHMAQCVARGLAACKGWPSGPTECLPRVEAVPGWSVSPAEGVDDEGRDRLPMSG